MPFRLSRHGLDDGTFWPTSYAVTGVGDKVRSTVARLVRRATSTAKD